MAASREYPERPLVGVGGVVIDNGRALLIRRASEPLRGEWSIPGGMLELGETLVQGVVRELLEETGFAVRGLERIRGVECIVYPPDGESASTNGPDRPRFHYVIADYLCERISGEHTAASDVTDVVFAQEEELERFSLTETALRILHKAVAMDR